MRVQLQNQRVSSVTLMHLEVIAGSAHVNLHTSAPHHHTANTLA